MLLTKFQPEGGYSNADAVLFWGSLAIGILGGLLALFVYRVGITLLGILAGFLAATWILSLKSGGLIQDQTGRIIFIVVLCLVGAIIVHFFEKIVIITSSSLGGAYSIVYGVDTFTKTGYTLLFKSLVNSGYRWESLTYEYVFDSQD